MTRCGWTAIVVFAALASAGCDGGGGGDAGDGDAGVDAGDAGDAGDGSTPESLDVRVFTYRLLADEPAPAAGATVRFLGPAGQATEAVTDGGGAARLQGVVFDADDPASVTAYLDGFAVMSWGELTTTALETVTSAEGTLDFWLKDASPRDLATITGTATGMTSEDNDLVASPTVPGDGYESAGPSFEVEVLAGVPFQLVVAERSGPTPLGIRGGQWTFHQWAIVDGAAATGAGTLDVDFAAPASTTTFAGSFSIPTSEWRDFFDVATAFVKVSSAASDLELVIGRPVAIQANAAQDGFEFEGVMVEGLSVDQVVTTYSLSTRQEGSRIHTLGPPASEPLDLAFPRPIEITTPVGTAAHPIGDAMEWTISSIDVEDPALLVRISLTRTGDGGLAHLVYLPPGTTSAVVPELPAAAPRDAVYGAERLNGTVEHCEPHPAARGLCARWSGQLPVLITP